MKITKEQLKQIIKEELEIVLQEEWIGGPDYKEDEEQTGPINPWDSGKVADALWSWLQDFSDGLQKNMLWSPNARLSAETIDSLDYWASNTLWKIMVAMFAAQKFGGLSDDGWNYPRLQSALKNLANNEAYNTVQRNAQQSLRSVNNILRGGVGSENLKSERDLKLLAYLYLAIKMEKQDSWGSKIQESTNKFRTN